MLNVTPIFDKTNKTVNCGWYFLYSFIAHLDEKALAPRSGLVDESLHKLAFHLDVLNMPNFEGN